MAESFLKQIGFREVHREFVSQLGFTPERWCGEQK
jgi:hypothetical protein